MALCRWSSSAWYIYEPAGSRYVLEVCGHGQFSVVDILRNYHVVKAETHGAGFIAALELRAYLTLWAYCKMKKINFKFYVKGLNFLRCLRKIESYTENPWDYKEVVVNGIPSNFQIKPCLCNKSLARYEEKRRKYNEIKNSPLMKALREE